jgi:UDP-N-acetylmuramate dehydrogenase
MTFEIETAYNALRQRLSERVVGSFKSNEPLARHSTFGVGGPADVWVSLDTATDLVGLVTLCIEQHWPLLLVGNGTNVLYADAGVRGVVARIALNNYDIEEQEDDTALLRAGAGVSWPRLINELAAQGWGGLEFGPGIPGTLGGGVISNAGAHHSDLACVLEWVEVLDARPALASAGVPTVVRYKREELDLSYRHSRFRAQRRVQFDEQGYPVAAPRQLIEPAEIVTSVVVRLHRADPRVLYTQIEEYKQHRRRTQPPQQSAGSVFKNPPGDHAGRLIELVGMKGLAHGNARISERHANFIVNVGGARAVDVAWLIREAYNRVYKQCGVALELEVELRGEWKVETS